MYIYIYISIRGWYVRAPEKYERKTLYSGEALYIYACVCVYKTRFVRLARRIRDLNFKRQTPRWKKKPTVFGRQIVVLRSRQGVPGKHCDPPAVFETDFPSVPATMRRYHQAFARTKRNDRPGVLRKFPFSVKSIPGNRRNNVKKCPQNLQGLEF